MDSEITIDLANLALQRVLKELNGVVQLVDSEEDCEGVATFVTMNIIASMIHRHLANGRDRHAADLEAYVRQSLDEAIEAAKKGVQANG